MHLALELVVEGNGVHPSIVRLVRKVIKNEVISGNQVERVRKKVKELRDGK